MTEEIKKKKIPSSTTLRSQNRRTGDMKNGDSSHSNSAFSLILFPDHVLWAVIYGGHVVGLLLGELHSISFKRMSIGVSPISFAKKTEMKSVKCQNRASRSLKLSELHHLALCDGYNIGGPLRSKRDLVQKLTRTTSVSRRLYFSRTIQSFFFQQFKTKFFLQIYGAVELNAMLEELP